MQIVKRIIRKIKNQIHHKFFYDRWIIGIAKADIAEIIRDKKFDLNITWLTKNKLWESYADPFILKTESGYDIFYERYCNNNVGDIWLMKIDDNFAIISNIPVFEDPIHASFPFLHRENGKIHIIPETAGENKLFHFEYDPENSSLSHKGYILHKPLLDTTILKHDNKYWLFGAIRDQETRKKYESWVFISEAFDGPYRLHPQSPVDTGLDGIRSAGDFIKIDNVIYRPTQNCKEAYGKSITINKLNRLTETEVKEDFYMAIEVNEKMIKKRISRIHTINSADGVVIVDGVQTVFSPTKPFRILKNWIIQKMVLLSILSPELAEVVEGQRFDSL